MPTLQVLNGGRAGQVCEFGNGDITIGRSTACDVTLPEQTVSRHHARIFRRTDGYYLEDLESRNGTFLNGRLIDAPTRLDDVSLITVDTVTLSFRRHEWMEHAESRPVRAAGGLTPVGLLHDDEPFERPSEILAALDATSAVSANLGTNAETKLRAILEITSRLGNSIDIEEILATITDGIFRVFPQADQSFILLADGPNGELMPAALKQRESEDGPSLTMRPIARKIARQVMSAGQALLYTDRGAPSPPEIPAASPDDRLVFDVKARSLMCAPLIYHAGAPIGIIHVDSDNPQARFRAEDLEVLACIATLAAQAVEHARLHEQRLHLDRRAHELETAQEVQRHLLPLRRPAVEGYHFFDFYEPAGDVGGDYYGYIELPDGRLAIALGDVAGKGVPAALLMARLCADVRYALVTTRTPADALKSLNRQLAESLLSGRFVTLVLCVLNPRTAELVIVNAGHMPPLVCRARNNAVDPIVAEQPGPPLGVDETRNYPEVHTRLEPGDAVILYTDGLSEAMDAYGAMYGTNRICCAAADAPGTADQLGHALLADVRRFMKPAQKHDDLCLLCFSRAAVPSPASNKTLLPDVNELPLDETGRFEREGSSVVGAGI